MRSVQPGVPMTRNDVKQIATRLNNPILLHALERHAIHGVPWEEALNAAVVELARQNEFFLNQLIEGRLRGAGLGRPAPEDQAAASQVA
jgi:hypothetical protein